MTQIIQLSERQKDLQKAVVAKKESIQSQLNALDDEIKAAMAQVNEIRSRIKPLKSSLVPLAEMEASICNIPSRAKYFTEYAPPMREEQFCDAFFEKMAAELKG